MNDHSQLQSRVTHLVLQRKSNELSLMMAKPFKRVADRLRRTFSRTLLMVPVRVRPWRGVMGRASAEHSNTTEARSPCGST